MPRLAAIVGVLAAVAANAGGCGESDSQSTQLRAERDPPAGFVTPQQAHEAREAEKAQKRVESETSAAAIFTEHGVLTLRERDSPPISCYTPQNCRAVEALRAHMSRKLRARDDARNRQAEAEERAVVAHGRREQHAKAEVERLFSGCRPVRVAEEQLEAEPEVRASIRVLRELKEAGARHRC